MNKALAKLEDVHAGRTPLAYACSSFNSKAPSALRYVAQLTPPPFSFKIAELRMANEILRLAASFFDADSAHQLDAFGGPRLT